MALCSHDRVQPRGDVSAEDDVVIHEIEAVVGIVLSEQDAGLVPQPKLTQHLGTGHRGPVKVVPVEAHGGRPEPGGEHRSDGGLACGLEPGDQHDTRHGRSSCKAFRCGPVGREAIAWEHGDDSAGCR